MRNSIRSLALSLIALALAAPAGAQEKTDPDEITVGVARLTLSMAYASVRVNGEEWEHSYFEEDGALLILEGMDRTTDYVLRLIPMEEESKFVDVAIGPKDWKLARLDRQTRQWQFKKKIVFGKWKPGEREAWEKEQERAAEVPEELPPEEMVMPADKPSKVDDAPAEKPAEAPVDEKPAEPAPEEEKPEEKPAEPAPEKPTK